MFPNCNDLIDWTILSKKIKWNKKLEKKLLEYQLLDSDILHHTGFPIDKVENLYNAHVQVLSSFRLIYLFLD